MQGAEVVISKRNVGFCPVKILEFYLKGIEINFPVARDRWQTFSKDLGTKITYSRSRDELHFHLLKINVPPETYGWHFFRRGGATAAAQAGAPERLLQRHWRLITSPTRDHYIEDSLTAKQSVTLSM